MICDYLCRIKEVKTSSVGNTHTHIHTRLLCGEKDNLQMCGCELAVSCMQPWVTVNEGCCFISTRKEKSWPLGTGVLKTSFVDLLILFPCQRYVSVCQLSEGNEVGMLRLDFIEVFDKIFYDLPLEEMKRYSQVNRISLKDSLLKNLCQEGREWYGVPCTSECYPTPRFYQ